MSPSGRIGYILHILDCLGQVSAGFIQVLYLGRASRTKETLPDFMKWRRVTRHPLVFRGLTGSQRTSGFGASHTWWMNWSTYVPLDSFQKCWGFNKDFCMTWSNNQFFL